MPVTAPTEPNSIGIRKLEKLIVITRSAIASPWRDDGVIWCSTLSTIGCTAPSVRPRMTEQTPMPNAPGISG